MIYISKRNILKELLFIQCSDIIIQSESLHFLLNEFFTHHVYDSIKGNIIQEVFLFILLGKQIFCPKLLRSQPFEIFLSQFKRYIINIRSSE
jgi:hypothetical protein